MLKNDLIDTANQGSCLSCSGTLIITYPNLFDSRFGIPGNYTAAKCSSCGLEQLTPLPSQDELKQLYENHYNFGGERDTTYTTLRQRFLFSSIYRLWTAIDGDISFHNVKGSGRLLDVGCNEGRGLQFYRRNGWQAEGLELNTNAAVVARNLGFNVHAALIEDFIPDTLYDAVVLSNVIEHSLNPGDMLRHVHRILMPGGQVWISCPNGVSLLRSIFGRFWINWHVPFHIVQFSPPTLQRMLQESGFGRITVRQETPALWVAHSLIATLFARPGRPTRHLRNPLLVMALIGLTRGLLFPLLWAGNLVGHGDCLVVTAEKSS